MVHRMAGQNEGTAGREKSWSGSVNLKNTGDILACVYRDSLRFGRVELARVRR